MHSLRHLPADKAMVLTACLQIKSHPGNSCCLAGGRQGAMSILARMQATADGFAHTLQQRMLAVPVEDLVALLEAVYAPFEAQVAR